jgi:WD40 repeat protein
MLTKIDQVLATCGQDGKIVLSHSQNTKCLLTLEDPDNKMVPVNSIQFTSNSQFLAGACNDKKVRIYDLKRRELCK